MKYFFISFFLLMYLSGSSQNISGHVVDSSSLEMLEFVNIQDLKSLKGTITNEEGYFELNSELPTTLRISFLGYRPKEININSTEEIIDFKIHLSSSSLLFDEIVLEGEKVNLGRDIIKKLIRNKKYRSINKTYSCEVYQQTRMTRLFKASEKDSTTYDSTSVAYLNEMASTHYSDGSKFKKVVKAEIKTTGDNQLKRRAPMTLERDFHGSNMMAAYNPIEYFITPEDFALDIYDNSFHNTTISDRPITSPIANTALANYTYRLKEMDVIGQDTIFKIAVRPRFKGAPLWTGHLYVYSKDYSVSKTELEFNPDVNGFSYLKLNLIYNNVEGQIIPTEKRIYYEAKVGQATYECKVSYRTSEYNFKPDYSRNFFSAEQVRYEEGALKPNTELMTQYRGVALEKDLKIFFNKQDSIYRSITSDEYLQEQDSIFNSITWKKVALGGVGHRIRAKGLTFFVNGIIPSIQVLGVDGFRLTPGGHISKEFINSNEIDFHTRISYGLESKDIKGFGNIGYTFYPQKFARIYVGAGDVYDFITQYQSLDAIIARSNFINNKYWEAGYAMELINGLYFNSFVSYSDKQSVVNVSTNKLSELLLGGQGTALEFDRYKMFKVETDFIYRFGQKYVTRGRKKIVLPDNNPILKLSYRKGIPGIGNSEVNFDYLEIEIKQKLKAMKIGSLNWEARAGSFVNKQNLRRLENNYFRGSTRWIFTNPLNDLQQLGPTIDTSDPFIQAGAIHHFDGFFLDKVPFVNKLQMELLTGAGTLIIPSSDLYHFEIYAGLGKKIKIRGETIQIAAYVVSSDSSLAPAKLEYKFGLNFYNAFAREWVY